MKRNWLRRLKYAVRIDAPTYFLVAVISMAVSIGVLRLFLNLAGFPRIGSGSVHISHVLWGGLLLFVAALLMLVVDYARVYIISAILTGAGMGLFIDEVGKFITSDYNYFDPLAAPIIYAFFLITLLVYLRIRRLPDHSMRRQLNEALELIQQDLIEPLEPVEARQVVTRLTDVAKGRPDDRKTQLAKLLLDYENADTTLQPVRKGRWKRLVGRAQRWLGEDRLRLLLILGLAALGLWTLKNVLAVLPILPPDVQAFLQSLRFGPETPGSAGGLYMLRLGLETVCGLAFLVAALFFGLRRASKGLALAYLTILLSLFTLDFLVFYFEQFSTILLVCFQFLLLFGLVDYHHHWPVFQEKVPRRLRGFLTRMDKGTRKVS